MDGVTVQGPPPTATAALISPSGRYVPPSENDMIGPYQVERELARGGMGVVYIARHTKLDRRVALKVQLAHAADSDEADRFQIEAQAAARLNHPHIVAILEVGEDLGRPFLAMDLVEGRSLKDAIDEEGPLDQDEAARIIEEMADALNYAHTRAILHRDVKPHNILLDGEGKALLTDFGLAKHVDNKEKGLTQTGQIMGTPAYMPPEQADGDFERVDRRADVYALGATLYQALTGQPPFDGQTAMQVVFKVLNEDVVSPKKLRPDLHVDLVTICLKCLEKEPEERYGTAKELAQELARFRQGQAILARPVGLLGRLQRRARRNQRATGVLLVVGVLVLFCSTAAAIVAEGLRRSAVRAEKKAQVEAKKALDAQRKEKTALDAAVTAKKVAVAEATRAAREEAKAVAEAQRARALSRLYQGIHELSLERPQIAIRSFAKARIEVGDLDPNLARASEICARQAAADTRFLGELRIGEGDLRCATLGRELAVVSKKAIRVWHQDSLERVALTRAHPTANPEFCAFLPKEGLLVYAVGTPSGFTIRALDWPGQKLRWEYKSKEDESIAATLCLPTPRGLVISTQTANGAAAWIMDPLTGRRLHELDSEARPGTNRAAVGTGALLPGQPTALVLGYDDGTIHLWDLKSLKPQQSMHLHTDEPLGAVESLVFLPPGHFGAPPRATTLFSGTGGGTTKRTTLAQGYEPEVMLRYTRGAVRRAALTLQPEPRLAVAYSDGRVIVYGDRFDRLASFGALRGDVSGLEFNYKGSELYVSQAGHLGRWALPARRGVSVDYERNLVTRTETPLIALSDQGQIAYVGKRRGGGEAILIVDSAAELERELKIGLKDDRTPDPGHPRGGPNLRPAVRSLAFRPGGGQLAVGIRPWESLYRGTPERGRLEVWDLLSGRVQRLPIEHEVARDRLGRPLEQIGLVRYSDDGAQLFQGFYVRNGAQPGRAVLRDSDSLDVLATLTWHLNSQSDIRWTPEGLLTSGMDGTIASWSDKGEKRAPERVYYHQGTSYPLGDSGARARSFVPALGDPPSIEGDRFSKWVGRQVPNAANREAEGLTAVDGVVGLWRGQERKLVLGGTGQGELYLWDRETGEKLTSWEGHREGGILACRFLPGGLVLSVGQEAKLWIPLGDSFSQIRTTLLCPPGATVLAVDLDGWKIAALTEEQKRRQIVVVDLEPVGLRGFEEDPWAAISPYQGWTGAR